MYCCSNAFRHVAIEQLGTYILNVLSVIIGCEFEAGGVTFELFASFRIYRNVDIREPELCGGILGFLLGLFQKKRSL